MFIRSRFGTGIAIILFSLASVCFAQCPHAGNNVGSIPYPPGGPYQGVSFRVWAPHATAVSVKDPISGRSEALVEQGGTGYWCKDVPGATTHQQYDYLITSPGFGTVTRRDPNARLVTTANNGGHAITYDPSAYVWQDQNFTPPPMNKLVIYEMDTGQFNPGPSGWGTFQSSIAKLDHISGMGFTAVELLPVTQFNGVLANPYGPTDQYAIDNDEYGGPDNLKAFVNACHQQGLAVIIDVVHNHWGPFGLADYELDGWHSSLYPGGIYFYDDAASTDRYDSPWGPRPDYSYAVVKSYILGQIDMWFNEYHADGLRWDSVSNIYNSWGGGRGTDPHTGKPGIFLPDGISIMQTANTTWAHTFKIAEDFSFTKYIHLDVATVAKCGLGFDAVWDATLGYFVRKDFPSTQISLSEIVSGLASSYTGNVFLQNITYVESHNELTSRNSRLYQLVDPKNPTSRTARKKATLGAGILFTAPQAPMIYQGDEFLDLSWLDNKTQLDWTNAVTWAGIVDLYGDLVHLRINAGGTSAGLADPDLNIYQPDKTNDVLVYDRYNKSAPGSDDVIVVANLGGTVFNGNGYQIGLPYGGSWQVLFNSDSTAYSSDFGNVGPAGPVTAVNVPFGGQPYSAMIPIGDYSVLVLSQARQ
jgi:1,4-alpha-glucan branching enzyme